MELTAKPLEQPKLSSIPDRVASRERSEANIQANGGPQAGKVRQRSAARSVFSAGNRRP
jgi:hypothetical protein